jgi:RNA polymerase sigma-70 factor (ECF subfamily)
VNSGDATRDDEPLNRLLEQLAAGDTDAVEQVVRTYEPYLRMVVRRQLPHHLRAKFDSIDIVQSVWADVVDGLQDARWRFEDAAHLRAFLVRAARNRLIDRGRRQQAGAKREETVSDDQIDNLIGSEPRPSETVGAEDLWRQMVQACPPQHRDILVFKRDGASLDEIAVRTGLHKSSVRRILYEVARKVAETNAGSKE